MRFAFFISPHGFGHAARACAVMSALSRKVPGVEFDIFTGVPLWFFDSSFAGEVQFTYHAVQTDVGFVQVNSLMEDYGATIEALQRLYPLRSGLVSELSSLLRGRFIHAVLCDISVLGIEVAVALGVPSVLIENFTWDWIYAGYLEVAPQFATFIDLLRPLYAKATIRVQAAPVCQPIEGLSSVSPIARPQRAARDQVRGALGIPHDAPLYLCSMGGIPGSFTFIPALAAARDVFFCLAGVDSSPELPENVRAISHRSLFYHPDLVAAADAIVGKVGYSTVAEAYYGRTQFLYVPRPLFRESAVMERFVVRELCGVRIESQSFDDGSWVASAVGHSALLKPLPHDHCDGSEQVARLILEGLE